MGKLLRLLQVLFSVCESAKTILFLKFPLKSGPSYAIVREKTNFTDRHVHVLSIFVKETIQLYCFDERKLQNSEGKGKNAKQSFASHVLSLLTVRHRRSGENQPFA